MIVLTPPPPDGCGMTEGLKALFAARDWFAVQQHDPYLAMAELCLRERTQAARAAWGLQRMEQIALVVLQPERWQHLDELIAAVRRYLPNASAWMATSDDELVPFGAPVEMTSPRKHQQISPLAGGFAGNDSRMHPAHTAGNGLLHDEQLSSLDQQMHEVFQNPPSSAMAQPQPSATLGSAPTYNQTDDVSVNDQAGDMTDLHGDNDRITREEIHMLLNGDLTKERP